MGFKHLNIDLLSSKWKPGDWPTLLDSVDNVFLKVPALVGRCLTSAARGRHAPMAQGSLEASQVPRLCRRPPAAISRARCASIKAGVPGAPDLDASEGSFPSGAV